MARRVFGTLAAALVLCAIHLPVAQSAPLQVLYAEPFRVQSSGTAGVQKPAVADLRVQAFGRTFDLVLEDNSRLLRATSAQARQKLGAVQLFKGVIKDVPGSWVRLTLAGGNYSGAMWDGSELYAIEPRESVDPLLLVPMPAARTGSAIYRLSDTQGGLLQKACGVEPDAVARSSPLDEYRALVSELESASNTAFAAAPREIEIAMVGDFEFTARRGAQAVSTMIDRMNVVDGIFSEQVGVATIPTDFITFNSDTDPFTSSNPSTLLDQFANYRAGTAQVRARGLAHLLTGRELSGNIVGIAYLGSLCVAREGASLSESSSSIDSALVIAHELGHNFGAPHDGETGSACASTPQQFLMAPFVNGSSTLSNCSLQRMQPHINGASCVVAARNRDVAVSVPSETIQAVVNQPFDYVADVTSVGDAAATNIIVSVGVPSSMLTSSASMTGATCSIQPTSVNCSLPELAAAQSRRLTVRLLPQSAGEFTATTRASASNDINSTNDSRSVQVRVIRERDVLVTASPQPLSVTRGQPFTMTFDIAAAGAQALNDVLAEITHWGIEATSASVDGGTCTTASTQPIVTCTLGSLQVGSPRRMTVQMISNVVGESGGSIFVRERADAVQRFITFDVTTRARRDISLSMSPQFKRVAIGTDAVWLLDVRSDGVEDVSEVHIRLSTSPLASLAVGDPFAASCVPVDQALDCDLGTVPAGSIQTLELRGRADVVADATINAEVVLPVADDVSSNDWVYVVLEVRLANDVQVQTPPVQNLYDGRTEWLTGTIRAVGANASEDVRATISLPQGFSFESATLDQGQCSVEPDALHVANCSVPRLDAHASSFLEITYVAAEPGIYSGAITVTALNDLDESNNSQPITFNVSPNVDGGLSVSEVARARASEPVDVEFTVTTNKYALPDARIEFDWYATLSEFSATSPGATCTSSTSGYSCTLGTIAANSSVPVTVRLRSEEPTSVSISAILISSGDTDYGNNHAYLTVDIEAATPPPPPPPPPNAPAPSSGSGGGGGRMDWLLIALMLTFHRLRRLARRIGTPSRCAATPAYRRGTECIP